MIITKQRQDSKLCKGLKFLDKRTRLNEEYRKQLMNMEKGIRGEELFDSLIKKYLLSDVLVLHDLLLVHSGSTFQIDTLIVSSSTLYLYEVKNYQGNYTNASGQFLTGSGKEINNPSTQLKRTETLLRKLLQDKEFDFDVKGYVVFTHPNFYLYNATEEDPFIFPPQFEHHFRSINNQYKTLKTDDYYLSDTLIQLQREEAPYQKQLPDYVYSHFKKGLNCTKCGGLTLILTQRSVTCHECKHKEELESTVLSNVEQFIFLFPNQRLTSNRLSDWMGETIGRH
ncbi:MAG: NERD domain-containing protein [Alkalibacterium sp.]|nr:NERD domain-containing protein [Alkalibacterium sp.]